MLHLTCRCCKRVLPEEAFSVHLQCKLGYDVSRCKECKNEKSRREYENVPIEKRIYHRTKSRCKERGIIFDLKLEDIVLPPVCPVLGVPFQYGHVAWTYSIDRFDPDIGYITSNINIISNRANMIKSNATAEELRAVAKWMEEENDRMARNEIPTN